MAKDQKINYLKSYIKAFYLTLQTLSTVGYGDNTPVTIREVKNLISIVSLF